MTNGTATQGRSFTLPDCGFTAPTGKHFLTWAIGSTSGTKIASGGTYEITAPTTVYAMWDANSYTVNYNGNKPAGASGSVSGVPTGADYDYDTNITLGAAPTLTGYNFGGWYKDAACTEANFVGNAGASVHNLTAVNGATVTLYAKWTAITDNATSVLIAGKELTSEKPYYHNGANGTPGTVDNTSANSNAYFNADTGTLTLNGLDVRNSTATKEMLLGDATDTPAYALFAKGDLTICVDGDNSVSVDLVTKTDADAFSLALYVTGNLTVQPGVTGSGSLKAESKGAQIFGSDSSRETAICSGITTKTLEVKPDAEILGEVSGTSAASAVFNAGINLDAVTVTGGTLKGIASGEVICGGNTSDYAISCGMIVNDGDLSLSAGRVEATGGQSQSEASTSFGVAMTNGSDSISITGGSFTAKSGTAATTVAVKNPFRLGSGITAKASTSSVGTSPVNYEEANNNTYRWVSAYPTSTVTSVEINPASVTVQKGGTQEFNATVTGENTPPQTVTWSLSGNSASSIDENGLLTVGATETAATITVTATSTFDNTKSGSSTITVITRYEIIQGENGKWPKGSTNDLTFISDGNYGDFTGVSVDGEEISSDKYTPQSGSTIVNLKSDYLKTLSTGRHTLRINYTGGNYAKTNFYIKASSPATGDSSNLTIWLCAVTLSTVGLSFVRRRKRNNR